MLPRQAPIANTQAKAQSRPTPTRWLMADARLGAALPSIVARMPPRSAVVVRPYAMDGAQRAMLVRVRAIGKARRHLMLMAGRGPLFGYDGCHGLHQRAKSSPVLSGPVHTIREARRARQLRVAYALISPLFATRSHAGKTPLSMARFNQLAIASGGVGIALGGMSASRFVIARRHGAKGWAAIDAWLPVIA